MCTNGYEYVHLGDAHMCTFVPVYLGLPGTDMCGSYRGEPATGGWTRARPHVAFLTAPAKLQTSE